ncbi:hypothetical protein I3842_01G296800 [Carya illinoinensis]|uniref:Acid phosphatase n=1 Tax=Carya illinoinensis TaxID=32201 RepID=A0A922K9Q9_CARIL|nr:hypothetical protein I3842_01G296800 [Carya illinoinensis]
MPMKWSGRSQPGVSPVEILRWEAVMLQSCQSKSSGVVEIQKTVDDYNGCKFFALYPELNILEADEIPSTCQAFAIWYIKAGQYAKDLNATMQAVENYFSSITSPNDGLDVVLMDVDDILSSDPHHTNLLMHRFEQFGCHDCVKEASHLKHLLIFRLYMKLRAGGWPLVLLSRRSLIQKNATVGHLISAGYSGWTSLIMRSDEELQMDTCQYFSTRRALMQRDGIRITGVISSRMDALTGPYLGKRIFKLPNALYYNFESTSISE